MTFSDNYGCDEMNMRSSGSHADLPGSISRNVKRVIDPTLMTVEDRLILGYFLEQLRKNGETCFYPGIDYEFPPLNPQDPLADKLGILSIPSHINLKFKLISRQRKSDPGEHRYDVYSGKIIGGISVGNGCYGNIEEIIGTLAPLEDDSVAYKGGKLRVGKILKDGLDSVMIEWKLLDRVSQLHAKFPTFFSRGNNAGSVIVMRRIGGEDLEQFHKKDTAEKLKNSSTLATDKRIELSIAVLRALKTQVHNNNIVHRDIKLANIIANIGEYVDVVIIDFGLSVDADEYDHKTVGTPLYASPEFYDCKQLTRQSDIYSVAWVLALIWRANDNPSTNISKANYFAHHCVFEKLFVGIDIDEKHKQRIEVLLNQMVKSDPLARGTLEYAIEIFETILLERKLAALQRTPESGLRQQVEKACMAGIETRKKLDVFGAKQCINFVFKLHEFKETILEAIKWIGDEPIVVTEFVGRLDVIALRGLKSRSALIEKIESLTQNYVTKYKKLDEMYAAVNLIMFSVSDSSSDVSGIVQLSMMPKLRRIQKKLELLIEKNVGSLTLDNLDLLNQQFEKNISLLQHELDSINYSDLLKSIHAPSSSDSDYVFVYGAKWQRPYFLRLFQDYLPAKSEVGPSVDNTTSSQMPEFK